MLNKKKKKKTIFSFVGAEVLNMNKVHLMRKTLKISNKVLSGSTNMHREV